MKNLLAIILVAVLATTAAFAQTLGPTKSGTGTFTAEVYCPYTFDGGDNDEEFLGYLEVGATGVATPLLGSTTGVGNGDDMIAWTLTGGAGETYKFTCTFDGVSDQGSMVTIDTWDWLIAGTGGYDGSSNLDENYTLPGAKGDGCNAQGTVALHALTLSSTNAAVPGTVYSWTVTMNAQVVL